MSTGSAAARGPSRIALDRGAVWRASESLYLAPKVDPIGEEVQPADLYRLFGRRLPDWYEDHLKAINDVLTGARDTPGVGRRTVLDADWGAVPDRVTDCTAAFQAALDQVAGEGGGTVFVPPVDNVSTQGYRLDGTITIPAGVFLEGAGARSIILARGGAVAIAFAVGFCRSGVRDLVLLGNDASPSGIGVRLTRSQFVELERLELWDFEIGIDVSDGSSFSAYNRIEHCEINRSTDTGIRIHQSSNGVTITGGRVFFSGIAVDIEDARAVSISGLSLESYTTGLRIAGAAAGEMSGCWMEKGSPGSADFDVDGLVESEFFEGLFVFSRSNHHADPWPLAPTTYNVVELGADPSGAVGASAIINAAIEAANSRGGGEVYLPAGTYLLDETIELRGEVTLIGDGDQATILDYVGMDWAMESATAPARWYRLRIRDLRVQFPSGANGGIHLNDLSLGAVERVTISGAGRTEGGTCLQISGAVNGNALYNTLRKVLALNAAVGYVIGPIGSNDTHLLDSRATVCTTGVLVQDANHTVIRDCAIEGCTDLVGGGAAVTLESTSTSLADGCHVEGNRFEGNDRDIVVLGTASFLRWLTVGDNHHIAGSPGTAYTNVTSTSFPNVRPSSGTPNLTSFQISPATGGPVHDWRASGISVGVMRLYSTNEGSGTPTVLELGAGRALGHALSIGQITSSVFAETAFITAAGAVTAVSLALSGNAAFSGASSQLTFGDGTTSGNTGWAAQKADANNCTYRTLRVGTATSGNRFQWQFDSSENDTLLSYDGSGNLHAIRPFSFRWNATSGRVVTSIARLATDRSTTIVGANIALSAALGASASVSISSTPATNEHSGEITVTFNGAGRAVSGTITITFPDGGWTNAGRTLVLRNGGTDTVFVVPGVNFTVTDSSTTIVITLDATNVPAAGATAIFRWWRIGGG